MTAVAAKGAPALAWLDEEPFVRALMGIENPDSWPDNYTYLDAAQPAAIAAALIQKTHRHLIEYSIGYLFRKKMKKADRVILGKASKADAKLKFFQGLDFMMEINWERWILASSAQRVALVDHELCHFGIEVTEKGENVPIILSHDLEEFRSIVDRWGLWRSDVKLFAESCAQFELQLTG